MSSSSSQYTGDLDSSGYGKIRAAPFHAWAKVDHGPGGQMHRAPRRQRVPGDSGRQVSTANGDQRFLLEFERRPDQRDFQSRGIFRVAHQGVRRPERKCVHRAADADSVALEPAPPEVLDGGEEAGTENSHGRGAWCVVRGKWV